jgi:hypothetical protein
METFVGIVFLLSALAVLPAFAASMHCSSRLNSYLRQRHPSTWAEIAPDSLSEPSLSAPATRFVTQRAYREIDDAHLNALGDSCFRLLYVAATIFLVFVLSGLTYGALKA